MRPSKYLVCLVAITCLGLIYTHQQFLLIKANYSIKECEIRFSHLLDHNRELMYNVTTLESPAHLEAKLNATGVSYDVPMQWAMVKRAKSEPAYKLAKVAEGRNVVLGSILNFLVVKAEAQALEN